MAEQINLVGNFTDNITPKLRKLDRELKNITKAFTKLGGKIRPVTREMGRLAMASERVATSMKAQRQDITSTTQALRAYTTASRKATSQQKKLKPARMPKAPKGGGGAGGGASVGTGIALGGIGMQLSSLVTSGILKGFEIGVGLLQKPFQFIANGIGERIEDEMSDIKAAGGIYAITKRMDNPFIKSFAEAESLTKETNRYLAELAGALPGDTQDYINVAKQISDSIGQIIANDEAGALRVGRELAEERGADTSAFDAGGAGATKAAYKEMIGELTKQTVLASGGSKMGAMGLPQLTERMISSDNLTTGMFRRYSAVFRDPQIMSALERNIAEINKTAKSSSERYEAIQTMYEEVVTPEYVRRVQRSTQGVMEALKTTFMNPEVGLLGLGRPIELAGDASNDLSIKFDQFGRMLDKNNEVTTNVADAARESLSVFEYLRDIFANVMIVLQPLIDSITSLFDPFQALGLELDKMRKVTMEFQKVYEIANTTLENAAKGMTDQEQGIIKATKGMRASLMAITDAFYHFGVLTEDQAKAYYTTLLDPSTTVKKLQSMVKEFIDMFLNSAAGAKVGGALGTIFGSVIKTFADLLVGLFGDASLKNEFVKGFIKGFNDAGGKKAIGDIFTLVFDKLKDLIIEAITTFPAESALLGGIVAAPMALPAIPGMVSALSGVSWTAVGSGLASMAAAIPPILAVLAVLLVLGGGLEGTMRQLTDFFRETFASLGGIFSGLFDTLGMIFNLTNDLVTAFGSLFGGANNAANGLDMLKIVLTPLTAAFQLIELGLRGLAESLAWARMMMTFGPERAEREKEFKELQGKRGESQGRANAYNASMLGITAQRKMLNDAVAELNSGKSTHPARTAELKAFIAALERTMATKDAANANSASPSAPTVAPSAPTVAPPALPQAIPPAPEVTSALTAIQSSTEASKTVVATEVPALKETINTTSTAVTTSLTGVIAAITMQTMTLGIKLDMMALSMTSAALAMQAAANRPVTVNMPATPASSSYNGNTSRTSSLGSAIATENRMKPAGSHLVIANSSEKVIPAYKGYSPNGMGGGSTTVTNNFTINGGGMNPQEIAEQVATIVMNSVEEASYSEIYTS